MAESLYGPVEAHGVGELMDGQCSTVRPISLGSAKTDEIEHLKRQTRFQFLACRDHRPAVGGGL